MDVDTFLAQDIFWGEYFGLWYSLWQILWIDLDTFWGRYWSDLDRRWNIFNSGLNLLVYHHYIRLACNSPKTFKYWHTPTFLHSSLILGHSTQSCHKPSKILRPSSTQEQIRDLFFKNNNYRIINNKRYTKCCLFRI